MLNANSPLTAADVARPGDVPVLVGEGIPLLVDVGDPERVDEWEPKVLVLDERLEVVLEGGWPRGFAHSISTGIRYWSSNVTSMHFRETHSQRIKMLLSPRADQSDQ